MANNQTRINNFFDAFENRLAQAIAKVPELVGNVVVNHALDNFKNEEWDGVAWEKRKKAKKSKKVGATGKLLVQSGRLRRSIRIIRSSSNRVTVGSDVPYASIHNYGGTISRASRSETFVRNRYTRGPKSKMFGGMGAFKRGTTAGKGLTFKAYSMGMPKRQFLGNTTKLKKLINDTVKEHLMVVLNN